MILLPSTPQYYKEGTEQERPQSLLLILFLFLTIFVQSGADLSGQASSLRIPFGKITQEEGLTGLNNAFVSKGSRGFIWISTFENGLIRFDGRSFKSYRADPQDSLTIIGNSITGPCLEDPDGNLWFSSYDGINCYIRKKDHFRTYSILDSTGHPLTQFYSVFHLDKQGKLWVRVGEGEGGKLYLFDINTKQSAPQHQMSGQRFATWLDEEQRVNRVIAAPMFSEKGAGIYTYGPSGELLQENWILAKDMAKDSANVCGAMFWSKDTIWLTTDKGLTEYVMGQTEDGMPIFYHQYRGVDIGSAWSAVKYDNRHLLVSTTDAGLLLFDVKKKEFIRPVSNESAPPFALGSTSIHELYLDDEQNLWVSDYGAGVWYGNMYNNKFQKIALDTGSNSAVSGLAEATDGTVWMVMGGQLMFIPPHGRRPQQFILKGPNRLAAQGGVIKLYRGPRKEVWVVQQNHVFQLVAGELKLKSTFQSRVESFKQLRNGNMLVSTATNNWLLIKSGETYEKTLFDKLGDAEDNWFTSVFEDLDGKVYISVAYQRIAIFQSEQDDLKFIRHIPAPLSFVGALEDTKRQCIWLSSPAGFGRLDKKTLQFQVVDQEVNLGTFWGVLSEEEDHIWLNNSQGLFRYTPGENEFLSFQAEDGSFKKGYSREAFLKRSNGELWFGGPEGISTVVPSEMKLLTSEPKVQLTRLKVHGKSYFAPDSVYIGELQEVNLGPGQNHLEFEFVGMEYSSPQAIEYEYFLENYDEQWIKTGSYNKALYQRLPPGSYNFKVRAANSDGIWFPGLSVGVSIRPYFYQTWWFTVVVILIILLGSYLVYRDLLKRRLRKAEIQNLEELNTFKSRFFTSITHEFRSPLTIVLSYLNDAIEKNKVLRKGNLEIMQRSAKQLLHLVNQILDLRKIEDTEVTLQPEVVDVVQLAEDVVEEFRVLAFGKGVVLECTAHAKHYAQYVDREKLRKILTNLVSNALKFTARGGNVAVKLFEEAQEYRVQVRDTGIGIPADKLPHIFEQFYQAHDDTSHKFGSGVGLALSKELAKAMGGDIEVESEPGKGSIFTLVLPQASQEEAPEQEELFEEPTPIVVQNKPALKSAVPLPESQVLADELKAEAEAGKEGLPLILIAEDNTEFQQYISDCLASHFRIVIRGDGEAAWEIAQKLIPDLIITDLKMPHMDGYERV